VLYILGGAQNSFGGVPVNINCEGILKRIYLQRNILLQLIREEENEEWKWKARAEGRWNATEDIQYLSPKGGLLKPFVKGLLPDRYIGGELHFRPLVTGRIPPAKPPGFESGIHRAGDNLL